MELFLRIQLLSEHAVLFDWFDHVAHVMRVIGEGLAIVGDGDGGQRVTSSTVARLLAIMVLLTPLRRFLNVNDNGFHAVLIFEVDDAFHVIPTANPWRADQSGFGMSVDDDAFLTVGVRVCESKFIEPDGVWRIR